MVSRAPYHPKLPRRASGSAPPPGPAGRRSPVPRPVRGPRQPSARTAAGHHPTRTTPATPSPTSSGAAPEPPGRGTRPAQSGESTAPTRPGGRGSNAQRDKSGAHGTDVVLPQTRPARPGRPTQHGLNRDNVDTVHVGDCWAAKKSGRCRPATRGQALGALRSQAPPCVPPNGHGLRASGTDKQSPGRRAGRG
ncbi:DUF6233 domain-containing protein [Streptomyces olivaceoviridis]